MNIEVKEVPPKAAKSFEMIVQGEKVGRIDIGRLDHPDSHFNVIFDPPWSDGLVHGWGPTQEAAVLNALKRGKEDANRMLTWLSSLELRLGITNSESSQEKA